MGVLTTFLKLLKPSENDYYNQQTEQADNWDKVDKFADDIQKNVDFNLLATLGISYGGILNNTEAKIAGKAYYDTTGKKLYKCIANTSINYADAGFFEALSNNDLLGKLQNLDSFPKIKNVGILTSGNITDLIKGQNFGFLCFGYTSGYRPPDAPVGTSGTAMFTINLTTPRYCIEWIDTNKVSRKLNYNNTWGAWY